MPWRPPFQRLLLASSPLCFCTNEHRRASRDLGCRACDRHLPMAILVCHVLGRLSRQFRRFSSRVPPCAFQSELPVALRHVIGVTVSDYYGDSVIIYLSVLRQSHVPLSIYVSRIL